MVHSVNAWQKKRGVKVIQDGIEKIVDVNVCFLLSYKPYIISLLLIIIVLYILFIKDVVVGDIALLEPPVELSGATGSFSQAIMSNVTNQTTAESDAINKISDDAQREGHEGEVETGEIDELASDISGTTIF